MTWSEETYPVRWAVATSEPAARWWAVPWFPPRTAFGVFFFLRGQSSVRKGQHRESGTCSSRRVFENPLLLGKENTAFVWLKEGKKHGIIKQSMDHPDKTWLKKPFSTAFHDKTKRFLESRTRTDNWTRVLAFRISRRSPWPMNSLRLGRFIPGKGLESWGGRWFGFSF